MNEVEDVFAELAASRKYKTLAPELLRRVARKALRSGGDHEATVKRAKGRLHQLFAAFVAPPELQRVEKIVAALPAEPDEATLRAACREILKRHASTRERSEPDAAFYEQIWKATGAPHRVVDVGCGLHPFALPWMGLARDCEYAAFDVDARIVAPIAALLRAIGQRGSARVLDVLEDLDASHAPGDVDADADELAARSTLRAPADVAFALKLLPTLERQREGASLALLQQLRARHVVVSFPIASLGGREKGMATSYARFLEALVPKLGGDAHIAAEIATPREPTWVVTFGPRP